MEKLGFKERFFRVMWPETLRVAIEQLREKEQLNCHALSMLIRRNISTLMVVFLLGASLILLSDGPVTSQIGRYIVLAMPFLAAIDAWLLSRRNMYAYINGEEIEAECIRFGTSLYGAQKITYSLPDGTTGKILLDSKPRLQTKDIPLPGQKFSIILSKDKKSAMPNLSYLNKHYSLPKKFLQETRV